MMRVQTRSRACDEAGVQGSADMWVCGLVGRWS